MMRGNAERPLEINETKMRLEVLPLAQTRLLNIRLHRSEGVVRGGVEPPTFRFSGALSRSETKNATHPFALLTGVTAGQQPLAAIVATCRGVPRSSVSYVGILWGSPAERGLVGILRASGDRRRK